MIAYKGFDENMCCRGKQYEEGKTYEEPEAVLCKNGMHACENPLDVFRYYAPGENVFHRVKCAGCTTQKDDDSKFSCTKMEIGAEIYVWEMIKVGVKATFDRAQKNKAATAGYRSTAATAGYRSTAIVKGKNSIAVANGRASKAKGTIGCYLVLTEYDDAGNMVACKTRRVDGKRIRENTFYTLKNGEFVVLNDEN